MLYVLVFFWKCFFTVHFMRLFLGDKMSKKMQTRLKEYKVFAKLVEFRHLSLQYNACLAINIDGHLQKKLFAEECVDGYWSVSVKFFITHAPRSLLFPLIIPPPLLKKRFPMFCTLVYRQESNSIWSSWTRVSGRKRIYPFKILLLHIYIFIA